MAEGKIVRKAGGGKVTKVPTITFVSKTATEIVFTITNNDDATADIFWEQGDTTPEANTLSLASAATSSNQTISGLSPSTEYIIYAFANAENKAGSETVTLTVTTDTPNYTAATGGSALINYNFTVTADTRYTNDGTYASQSAWSSTDKKVIQGPFALLNRSFNVLHFWDINDNYLGHYWSTAGYGGFEGDVSFYTGTNLIDRIENFTSAPANAHFFALSDRYAQDFNGVSYISESDSVRINEYDEGGKRYRSHTFTQNGTFVVTAVGDNIDDRNKVDYLIIAGGGSGGEGSGGGGGAGGYRTTYGSIPGSQTPESKITVSQQSYSVVIGAGGSRATVKGGDSSAFGITSTGGGRGGLTDNNQAEAGGSGGGGGRRNSRPGGAGILGQGNAGGNAVSVSGEAGGGGGGAGGGGGTGYSFSIGGNGGVGLSSTIRTGVSEFYAGGGGGGGTTGGTGGNGGGGNGGIDSRKDDANGKDLNGVAHTGGGGGGGGNGTSPTYPAPNSQGGSGIVIIRYEIAPN